MARTLPARTYTRCVPRIVRENRLLTAFAFAYTAAFVAYGIATRARETFVYLAVIIIGMIVVSNLYAQVGLTTGVLWGLSIWGAAHMAGGLINRGTDVLYNQKLWPEVIHYDRIVHAFGFGFGTIAAWQALRPSFKQEKRIGASLAVHIALTGMGIGALNEVIEFTATRLHAGLNVGGYDNTGWDLIFNLLGAAIAAIWITRRERRETTPA